MTDTSPETRAQTVGPGANDPERLRDALIRAAIDGHQQASLAGLCAEGAWEAGVSAMRRVDLAAPVGGSTGGDENELVALAHAWDRAMLANDPAAIGRFMADDWTIIGSDGAVGDKTTLLALIASGALTHDEMTSEDVAVRRYGDAAVVTSRGVSGGTYHGRRFRELERVSCVFVRVGGEWRCVITHLSRLTA